MISRDEAKSMFDNFGKSFTLDEARQDVHLLIDRIYNSLDKQFEKEIENNVASEDAKSCVIDTQRKQLLELKAENELLKRCVEEAIMKPMGVEPHIYSDWKASVKK